MSHSSLRCFMWCLEVAGQVRVRRGQVSSESNVHHQERGKVEEAVGVEVPAKTRVTFSNRPQSYPSRV